jgi:hypothetical protein
VAEQNDISCVLRKRCAIEFCVKLGKSGEGMLEMSQTAYGAEAMNRTTVFRWSKHFKDGNKKVVDDPRSGSPSTAVTEVNTEKAEQLLKEDRRLSPSKLLSNPLKTEFLLNNIKTQFVPHRKHITFPLRSPTG